MKLVMHPSLGLCLLISGDIFLDYATALERYPKETACLMEKGEIDNSWRPKPENGDGYDAVMRIREIMKKHNVSFYYIRGHKTSRDAHVVCDFSSRILLTRILKNAVCSDCAGLEHSLQ